MRSVHSPAHSCHRGRRGGFLLLLGVLLASGCAPEDPRASFLRRDYSAALPGLRNLVQQGNPEACNMLGVMHYLGLALPRDNKQALLLFERAAVQKHAGAQFNAGLMHFYGLGTHTNLARAYTWFYASARQGKDQAEAYVIFVGQNMTANQILLSMSKANEYLRAEFARPSGDFRKLF